MGLVGVIGIAVPGERPAGKGDGRGEAMHVIAMPVTVPHREPRRPVGRETMTTQHMTNELPPGSVAEPNALRCR